MQEKIRILHIVPNMGQGGLENFIMNLYRNINTEKIQFDFLVHYRRKEYFDKEIEDRGGKIYRFSLREDNNIFKYIIELNKFFKNHKEYKIIHCHMSSIGFLLFLIAKLNGVQVRIAHSHNSDTEKTIKGFIKSILIKPYKYVSTINFACSEKAGKYLFKNKKFEIVPNGIDIEKFKFNYEIRKKIRKQLEINDDEFVIGHVGRFQLQKNHDFLIDIFKEVSKKQTNSKLVLIGIGNLEEKIKEKVVKLNLQNNVLFLGLRENTNEIYQAMDCFALPSFFEGLPLVGVEAQTSGLKCVFSDVISEELKIIDDVSFIPIKDPKIWADVILNFSSKDRNESYDIAKNSKYNIKKVANYLEEIYIKGDNK